MSEVDRLSTCEGKETFATRSLAVKAAVRRRGREAYRCRHCHKWHVGTPSKRFIPTKGRFKCL